MLKSNSNNICWYLLDNHMSPNIFNLYVLTVRSDHNEKGIKPSDKMIKGGHRQKQTTKIGFYFQNLQKQTLSRKHNGQIDTSHAQNIISCIILIISQCTLQSIWVEIESTKKLKGIIRQQINTDELVTDFLQCSIYRTSLIWTKQINIWNKKGEMFFLQRIV